MTKAKFASVLSLIIVVLTVIAAGGGLIFPHIYQENPISNGGTFSQGYWRCNDLVTLIIAVPLLATALALARRGSLPSHLVWLGVIHYTLYNYSFYLFGAILNWFFLLYVALFTLPILVLVFVLADIDIDEFSRNVRFITPIRWIGGYMFVLGALLVIIWSAQWVSFVWTGSMEIEKGSFIRTVGGMDMSLLASGLLLGAVWLWKRRPWGYIIATILNVSVTIYMLVLTAASVTHAMAGVEGAMAEVPQWVFFGMASLAASLILVRNLQPEGQR